MERLQPEKFEEIQAILHVDKTEKIKSYKVNKETIFTIIVAILFLLLTIGSEIEFFTDLNLIFLLSMMFIFIINDFIFDLKNLFKKIFSSAFLLYFFGTILFLNQLFLFYNSTYVIKEVVFCSSILLFFAKLSVVVNLNFINLYTRFIKNKILSSSDYVVNYENGLPIKNENIKSGDIILCEANKKVAVDGKIVKGETSINRYFKNQSIIKNKNNQITDVFAGDIPTDSLIAYQAENRISESSIFKKIEYIKKFSVEESKDFFVMFNFLNILIFCLTTLFLIVGISLNGNVDIVLRLAGFLIATLVFTGSIQLIYFNLYFKLAKLGIFYKNGQGVSRRIGKTTKILSDISIAGEFAIKDYFDSGKYFNTLKMLHGAVIALNFQKTLFLKRMGETIYKYLSQNNIFENKYLNIGDSKTQQKKIYQLINSTENGMCYNFDGVCYEVGNLNYFKTKKPDDFEHLSSYYNEKLNESYELFFYAGGVFIGALAFELKLSDSFIKRAKELNKIKIKSVLVSNFSKSAVYKSFKEICDVIEIYFGANLQELENYKNNLVAEKHEFMEINTKTSGKYSFNCISKKTVKRKDGNKLFKRNKRVSQEELLCDKTFILEADSLDSSLYSFIKLKKLVAQILKIYITICLLFLPLCMLFFSVDKSLIIFISIFSFILFNILQFIMLDRDKSKNVAN